MNEIETVMKINNNERIAFIDYWIDFMKNNSNDVWSVEHNRLINSLIE